MACCRPSLTRLDKIVRSARFSLLSPSRNSSTTSTVSSQEISKFSSLSSKWWNPRGEFAPLHRLNSLRVPLIQEVASDIVQPSTTSRPTQDSVASPTPRADALQGLRVLDIGCGGGLLSEPMARLGASVLGVDASESGINAAQHHCSTDPSLSDRLQYQCGAAEDLPVEAMFDIVVASEVIEHVSDQRAFVNTCSRLVRPGGALVFTTLNKTCLSHALGIVAAESLGLAPAGTHEWEKFISPDDLSVLLLNTAGVAMRVEFCRGMDYNPLTQRWSWSTSMPINYALVASKRTAVSESHD